MYIISINREPQHQQETRPQSTASQGPVRCRRAPSGAGPAARGSQRGPGSRYRICGLGHRYEIYIDIDTNINIDIDIAIDSGVPIDTDPKKVHHARGVLVELEVCGSLAEVGSRYLAYV